MKFNLKYLFTAALLFSGLFLSACQEEKDSQVRITVKDAAGNPVVGATVKLEGQPSDSIYVHRLSMYDLDQVTNDGGIAVFSFNEFYDQGDNGFAILNMTVTKGALTATGYVKVIDEEIVEETVVLE